MKTERILLFLGVTLMSVATLAGCMPLVQATEERTTTFPLTGRLTLIVDGRNGHVDVRGSTEVNEVQVQVELTAGAPTRSEAEELLANIDLEMTQNGNEVILRHRSESDFNFLFNRHESVSFDIVIPMNADLDISTANGHINIDSIDGTLSAHTSNGAIDIYRVHGDLDLGSSNGRIEVHDGLGALVANTSNGAIHYEGRLIGPAHSASTSNGAISFRIPSDLDLEIRASTSNGSIRSSLPLSGDHDGKSWNATLNSPNAKLSLRTSNGSITINELR